MKAELQGNLFASMPRNSGESENSTAGNSKWPQHFQMSPAVVPHMEKVYSIVR